MEENLPEPENTETFLMNQWAAHSIVIHPDIIRHLRDLYDNKRMTPHPVFDRFIIDEDQKRV